MAQSRPLNKIRARRKLYWTDYPELDWCVRTEYEDKLSNKVCKLLEEFGVYVDQRGRRDLSGDLQGAVHLLQGIIITVQKRRLNHRRKWMHVN